MGVSLGVAEGLADEFETEMSTSGTTEVGEGAPDPVGSGVSVGVGVGSATARDEPAVSVLGVALATCAGKRKAITSPARARIANAGRFNADSC